MLYRIHSEDLLLEDILEKLEFSLVQPETPGSFSESSDLSKVEAYKALDVANTRIWDRDTKILSLQFLSTPRLSTVAIAYILNRLVKNMPKDKAYLNVGTWCGFSFFAGIIGNEDKTCIGIDDFSEPRDIRHIFEHQYAYFKNANSRFLKMDYLEYFKTVHTESIGVYFYDAEHTYEQQLRALEVADPFLAGGSYIMIDDTSGGPPRDATMDFVKKKNGQYKIVLDIQTPNNCHPTFWCGVMILKKV